MSVKAIHAALVERYGKPICAGFRDDMSDVERWVAYCLTRPPIEYSLYFAAVAGGIPMPEATGDELAQARALIAEIRHR